MTFDPSQFGATPATGQSQGGFDPSQFGATSVSNQLAPSSQPPQSLSEKLWSSLSASPVGQAVQQGGQAVNAAFTAPGESLPERTFNAAGAAAGAVPNVVASAIPGAKLALNTVGGAASATTNFVGGINDTLDAGAEGLGIMTPAARAAEQQQSAQFANSSAGQGIQRAATIGQSAGNMANLALGGIGVANAADSAIGAAQDINSMANGAKAVTDSMNPTPTDTANFVDKNIPEANPDIAKVQDIISPKVDAKATKLALAEGRIAPGQDPTLLKDGTPDQIVPSDKTIQAASTVQAQIPGAAKMSQPELYAATDAKIAEIGQNLRPQMDATPVTPATVEQITNDWNSVKEKQLADPYTPSTVNVEKLQAQFENDFLKGSKSDNLGDLWDTRIKYDNSVPANVKAANSLSSDVLQTQKSIWLQNRGILNDAINNTTHGLGSASQQAFSDMSDMYTAQKGIQSSYRIPKEGAPSGVKQALNSPAGKIGKAIVGGAGAIEIGKKVLTGEF